MRRYGLCLIVLFAVALGVGCDDDYSDPLSWARARSTPTFEAVTPTPTPSATSTPRATSTAPAANLLYASVTPIEATFDEKQFQTTYTIHLIGPLPQGALVNWSGPNCGSVLQDGDYIPPRESEAFNNPATPPSRDVLFKYVWQHPHPPCGNTPDHADVTVVATVSEGGDRTPRVVTTCRYVGSATSAPPGTPCVRQ